MAEIHLPSLESMMHVYENHEIFDHPVYYELDNFDILASNMSPSTGVETCQVGLYNKDLEFVYSITSAGIKTCIAAKGDQ